MPKIQRTTQLIFADNAGSQQITAFGTAKDQTPVYTDNVAQIQNTNYGYGWSSALLPDKAPWQEDMNALFFAVTSQLAYLFQEGIPEYDAGTSYSAGGLAKTTDSQGNIKIIKSLVDDNLGNSIDDPDYWSVYQSDGTQATYEIGLPQPTFSNTLLANEIWLEGQEVSRTTYSKLFAIYGTTYGTGNGSTTFNLPDCRNRVLWGTDNSGFGYIEAGVPDHQHRLAGNQGEGGAHITSYPNNAIKFTGVSGVTDYKYTLTAYTAGTEPTLGLTGNAGATNQIYGKGKTVQPPAIKCRVKTRFI